MRTRACRVQPDARDSRGSAFSSFHTAPVRLPRAVTKTLRDLLFPCPPAPPGAQGLSALISSPPAAQLAETSRFYAILIAFLEALCLPAP